MTLRMLKHAALLAVFIEGFGIAGFSQTVGLSSGSGASSDLSVTAEVIGRGDEPRSAAEEGRRSDRFYLGRQRKIVEFILPPVAAEFGVQQPPPLVTLYSPPEVRAKYPPNPDAKTVSQAFREEFGELVKYEFELKGPDEELLIRQAHSNALMSLAGRVYFDNQILLSQDLLAKYFEQNGNRFMRDVKVSDKKLVGGENQFKVTFIIDQDKLLKDLVEKRFVQRPQLRPIFYVFLDQKVNGNPDEQQLGKKGLESVIRDRNQRYADDGLPSLKETDFDITKSKENFLKARQAAQRNNVEIAISGSMVARPADLDAPISEKDWIDNTVEVAVDTDVLPVPVAAHLPIDTVLKNLDAKLAEREKTGEQDWWDLGSIEVEVPLDAMVLTDADRAAIEESGITPTALVPLNRIGLKRNYYKPYYYTSVRMTTALVRVDNGEIIAEHAAEATAAGDTRDLSVQAAIQKAAGEAANELIDKFLGVWPETMGDKVQYVVMATSISPGQTEGLIEMIEQSSPGAKVRLRSLIGSTAVLSVHYPSGIADLMRSIDLFEYPKLRLVWCGKDALEYKKI